MSVMKTKTPPLLDSAMLNAADGLSAALFGMAVPGNEVSSHPPAMLTVAEVYPANWLIYIHYSPPLHLSSSGAGFAIINGIS